MTERARRLTHEGVVKLRHSRGPRLADLAVGTHWKIGAARGVVLGLGQHAGVLVNVRDTEGLRRFHAQEWSGKIRVELEGPGVLQRSGA